MLQHPKALSSEWIDYFIISIRQMSFLNSSDGCIFSFPISSLNRGQVWTFRISTRHITSARTAAAAVNTLFFQAISSSHFNLTEQQLLFSLYETQITIDALHLLLQSSDHYQAAVQFRQQTFIAANESKSEQNWSWNSTFLLFHHMCISKKYAHWNIRYRN